MSWKVLLHDTGGKRERIEKDFIGVTRNTCNLKVEIWGFEI